jgi:predicted ATPase/class 3 adenylate cyclase
VPERVLPTGTVTLLFTDIEGSTELLKQVGDRAYAELLARHAALLRRAFAEEQGTEVDTQGDAFFVAFPRAWHAVAGAAAAQRALAAEDWPGDATVRVRMGLHTGEPTLGGHGYVGLDVNRTARIAASGHGGQVLLSERTLAMARHDLPEGVAVRDLGEHRLKDLPQPEHIFQLEIAGLPADFPRLKTLDVPLTNLPALRLTSFIGRDREMTDTRRALERARLLTLTGPGGTGKSRLSLEVASGLLSEFPQGVWLIELAALRDGALIPQTVAAIFGIREIQGRSIIESLVDYLRHRRLLLILDNCEHLIAASAELAAMLLRSCPHLSILASSREPLGVPGEVIYPVPPLSRPDSDQVSPDQLAQFEATRLFLDRATPANLVFTVTAASAGFVARIARRLDGIPLAIELAAARAKVLTVEQIATRLDDRFRLLTGGSRTGLPHHQTLRATVEWSYDLLPPLERTLFQRLSVFAGGFPLEAVETVCASKEIPAEEMLDLLAHLVDKSLVVTEGGDDDFRYHMLETIRLYGRDRLVESGEAEQVRGRHLAWCWDLAERAEPELYGPNLGIWLDRLERDHDDMRVALRWATGDEGDVEFGLRLAGALVRFWELHGYLGEGRAWLAGALSRDGSTTPRVRAKALYGAAVLAFTQGDYDQAAGLAEEALRLYREAANQHGVALALNLVGVVARNQGDYARAAALLEESVAIARGLEDRWPLGEALNMLGVLARRQRDHARAKALLTEALALWRAVGDKDGLATCLGHLGVIARTEGDYARAQQLHEESLALRRELGDRVALISSLTSLGTIAMNLGDYPYARTLFQECLALAPLVGDKPGTAAALGNLAIVAHLERAEDEAEALIDEAEELWRRFGHKAGLAGALGVRAMIAHGRGEPRRAALLFVESLRRFQEFGDRLGVTDCLVGLARVTAEEQPEVAVRLLSAADALRRGVGAPMPPSDRREYDRGVAGLKERLSADRFAAAWAMGQAWSFEQAARAAERIGTEGSP